MSKLREKILKNSTIKQTSLLADSIVFSKKDMIVTDVPLINVASSGRIDGGMGPGLTMIAGPSKHFKTGFALVLGKSFLNKYPDGLILFYDSEFGTPENYFRSFGIPEENVVHTPILNVEQLKHDISVQLENIDVNDKIMIIIDSLGNLASLKEAQDALEGKTVADMSRAKALKSLFRIISPHLTLKNIPLVAINHTYKELALFPKDVVGGGTGSYYNADNIWILGRQQDKDTKEKTVNGYNFIINIEKSRYVREKSKIPINVTYEGGINKWSGMLELALEAGYVVKPSKGKYCRIDKQTGELISDPQDEDSIKDNDVFWETLLKETDFADSIKRTYSLPMVLALEETTDNTNE